MSATETLRRARRLNCEGLIAASQRLAISSETIATSLQKSAGLRTKKVSDRTVILQGLYIAEREIAKAIAAATELLT